MSKTTLILSIALAAVSTALVCVTVVLIVVLHRQEDRPPALPPAAVPFLFERMRESKESIAKVNVKTLSNACEQYNVKYSRWPTSLAELTKRQPDGGRILLDAGAIVDPWGKPYQYNPQGPRNDGDRPDVWTVSPDGKEIGNWPTGR